jgi:hypothetical protein
VLKRRMLRVYGSRLLRVRAARRVFVAVARWWSRQVAQRLARLVAADVADYVGSGLDVVEVVGVGASPSCGVWTTLDLDSAVRAMACLDGRALEAAMVNRHVVAGSVHAGSGVFVTALRRALARRRVEVRFVEHDLIAELRDAGALGCAERGAVADSP